MIFAKLVVQVFDEARHKEMRVQLNLFVGFARKISLRKNLKEKEGKQKFSTLIYQLHNGVFTFGTF